MERIKESYLFWHTCHSTLPKTHRHTLGNRIDTLYIELIEAVSAATFLSKTEKLPYLRLGIRKRDTITLLLLILFETKSLDAKKYIHLSTHLEEIGKMLGGWLGQVEKQNSPTK